MSSPAATPPAYTAAQIARALDRDPRSVRRTLKVTTPDGQVTVAGMLTNDWHLSSLPEVLLKELDEKVIAGRYRDRETLLARPPEYWQPPVPLSECHESALARATKLQRVFAPSLARWHDDSLSTAEFERLGVEDYLKEFGHAISQRHFRTLFKRTIERDQGNENFARLEIYLDAAPKRKAATPIFQIGDAWPEFRFLCDFVRTFADPTNPTLGDIECFWVNILETYQTLLDSGKARKKVKRALLNFLNKTTPWLARNPNALRVSFDRKYARWLAGEKEANALHDGRALKKGVPRAEPIPQQDLDKLAWHAHRNCGGRLAQAKRELIEANELTSQTTTLLMGGSRKSYVLPRIRAALRHEIKNLRPYELGQQAIDDATASIDRSYDDIASMDALCADDVTLPVYWYVPDGQGWFNLVRGQCLVYIDFRTLRVLGFSQQPDKGYNSRVIRSLTTHVCGEYGLPKIFYYERGIWQNSKILTGGKLDAALSSAEVELGLREFGVKFIHATRARSKPVELVLGRLQSRMEGERGYCGRDERRNCPERTRQAKLAVEAQREQASKFFYSFDEWQARLVEILAQYNSEPQEGKILQGLSPDEAFARYWPTNNPPITFDARCRYLLAHHKRATTITREGISLQFGCQKFNYRNEQTSRLQGQRVLAWFDPEYDEILTVTDLNRQNPFCVTRTPKVSALAATNHPDSLKAATVNAASQQSWQRARYKILKSKFDRPVRQCVPSCEIVEVGQEIARQRAQLTAETRQHQRIDSRFAKAAGALGMHVAGDRPRSLEQTQAAERLAKVLAENDDAETPKESDV